MQKTAFVQLYHGRIIRGRTSGLLSGTSSTGDGVTLQQQSRVSKAIPLREVVWDRLFFC